MKPKRPLIRSPLQERLLDILRAKIDEQADFAVLRFSERLLALPDRSMRSLVLAERLRRYDAHLCLVLLEGLLDRANRREPGAAEILLDLTTARPLAQLLGYAHARSIYELARGRDRMGVSRLFLSPETLAGMLPGDRFMERQNIKMPDAALGWRKAHARGTDRMKLDRLLFDRNPAVIQLLLMNPRLTERDVVRITAMQPTNPDNLLAVFRHSKWIKRYRVKVALSCNPYTPVDVALACLPHLMVPRLRFVVSSGRLKQPVRDMARALLARRAQNLAVDGDVPVHRVAAGGEIVLELEDEEIDIDLEAVARELEDWRADT
jgi:hypothetical protein